MEPIKKNATLSFTTLLLKVGKTATGFVVPDKIVEQLAAGKKPPVYVTINKHTYRNTVAVMGGVFMIGVSAENREKAGVKGGDKILVSLSLDTEKREVILPADFKKLLDQHIQAKKFFEGLSYSKKRGLVLPIEQAKSVETRERRIKKAMLLLQENKP